MYSYVERSKPNDEHGLMPGAMLVDSHSGGQEVAGGLYTVQSDVQTSTSGIVGHRIQASASFSSWE